MPEESNHEPAAERSKHRTDKPSDRRMPARRKVASVLQDGRVYREAADDPYVDTTGAVTRHRDRRHPGIGNEMLKWSGEDGSHDLQYRQQRQGDEHLPRQ